MKSLLKATLAIAIAMLIGSLSLPAFAQAQQKFPTKPVRLLVAYAPGGATDALARMLGPKMSESWGRAVVVDNRPGAGGMLAAAALTKAAPDGHTLLLDGGEFSISAVMQPNLPYDSLKDFAGVGRIGFGTAVLVVTPALGVKSVKELIALAKAQPGKIIFGAGTAGSASYLSGTRFNLAAGIKVVTVAFKERAMIETVAGRTQYAVGTLAGALPFIQDEKLLALGVFTPQRSPQLPDVPAIGETLPEFKRPDAGGYGLFALAGTPRPILHRISKEVARIVALPDIKERLLAAGIVPAPNSPEEHDKTLREHIEVLTALVRDAGLKPK
jgi:tripartite-type tricarboxylate transporter receptor subunit TctC